jgi:hypothetical protein
MKLTIAITLLLSSAVAAHAESYNYSCSVCVFPTIATGDGSDGCEVVGNAYPLRVDENKKVLEWRGKKDKLTQCMVRPCDARGFR